MTTLLLRLAGPMQSWGLEARFSVRDTAREPTKSGVLGLLCAALGKPREERPEGGGPTLPMLAQLRMGVRVEREGRLERDYHTAGGARSEQDAHAGVALASGSGRRSVLSERYYLADASFLVGLEGERPLLATLEHALREPVWQLSLGRKAFVPGVPVHLPGGGLREASLEDALQAEPGILAGSRYRLVIETPDRMGVDLRRDVPLDFATRRFGVRAVRTHVASHGGAP
jgi:CRISPR system Cascade subunit CasD